MKYVYICILMFLFKFNIAQVNLVPNSSFETYTICPWGPGLIGFATGWFENPHSTSEFFHTCADYTTLVSTPANCTGFQYPRTDSGYAGFFIYSYLPGDTNEIGSEFIETQLTQTLKAGACYYFEMYYSLANVSGLGINRLEAYVNSNGYSVPSELHDPTVHPQFYVDTATYITDTLNWRKLSGVYIALGGEKYLTIGNFKGKARTKRLRLAPTNNSLCTYADTNICYIYVDDVSLYEIPKPNLGADKTMCLQDDSITIGDNSLFDSSFTWYRNDTLMSDTTKGIIVKPNYTSTYILHNQGCASDTIIINVGACSTPNIELQIPNVFSPNADNVNDAFKIELYGAGNIGFTMHNRWGNLVYEVASTLRGPQGPATTIIWDGRTTSGEPCSEGVYFYTLKYTDVNGEQQSKNGYVSLFR